jgi:uncharacterized lipoprotein YajG
MKKLLLLAIIASMALFTGCTTQPMPTKSGGQSKASTLSGNEVSVFTLPLTLNVGSTFITAEDGSSVTVAPSQPKSTPLTF